MARPTDRGWVWAHVGLAALAMVATLPGRTHGLGLITEPLLADQLVSAQEVDARSHPEYYGMVKQLAARQLKQQPAQPNGDAPN